MTKINIIMMRHAESELNSNTWNNDEISYNLKLNKKGKEKTKDIAIKINDYLKRKKIDKKSIMTFYSPANRCKETVKILQDELRLSNKKESLLLYKQSYGIFDKPSNTVWKDVYPFEYKKYTISKKEEGKFFAKVPYGESAFEVYIRIYMFCKELKDTFKKDEDTNILIVAHSSTIKILTMILMEYDVNWYERQENFNFESIRHIIIENDHKEIDDILL